MFSLTFWMYGRLTLFWGSDVACSAGLFRVDVVSDLFMNDDW